MRYLFLALLLSPLAAQRTWIVDAANGSGTHFLDIPPAIAAATDGDTILVRAATTAYRLAEVTKGIHIVGVGTPTLGMPRLERAAMLSIRDIGGGKTAVFSGFDTDESTIIIRNCTGAVVLQHLTCALSPRSPSFGISIFRAAAVAMNQVAVLESAGLLSAQATIDIGYSSVYCSECSFIAANLFHPWQYAAAGLRAYASRVVLARCTVFGGRTSSGQVYTAPAVRAGDGVIMLSGSTLVGGGGVAFEGNASLVRDQGSVIHGSIDGGARVITGQVPLALASVSGTPGLELLDLHYVGESGDLAVQVLGLLQSPVADPFGQAWVDPRRMLVVDIGIVSSTGTRVTSLRLPAPGLFTGLTLATQALVLRGGAVAWSAPATFVAW